MERRCFQPPAQPPFKRAASRIVTTAAGADSGRPPKATTPLQVGLRRANIRRGRCARHGMRRLANRRETVSGPARMNLLRRTFPILCLSAAAASIAWIVDRNRRVDTMLLFLAWDAVVC